MTSVAKYKCSLKSALGLAITILVVVFTSSSCGSQFRSAGVTPKAASTPQTPIDVDSLCDRIADIRVLPQKDNPVDDPVYNGLVNAGEKAIPCLIGKITDTSEMPDPRQAPKVTGVRVGDVAYFMLVRLGKLDFVELLPPDARKKYGEDGVYGYFETIDERNNRKELQEAAYAWYEQKYGKDLRKK